MASFLGKWEQIERTNTKNLVKAFGLPEEQQEAAQRDMCRETMEIRLDRDYFIFKITSPLGTRENKFKLGDEYEVKTSFANFKAVARFEGAGERKVVQKLMNPLSGAPVGVAINEVKGDTMLMTLKIGDVESVSTFQRVSHRTSQTT